MTRADDGARLEARREYLAECERIRKARPGTDTATIATEAARNVPEAFSVTGQAAPARVVPFARDRNSTPEQSRAALPDLKRRLAEAEARARAFVSLPSYLTDHKVRPASPAMRWCPELGRWAWVALSDYEVAAAKQGKQLPETMPLREIEARRQRWHPTPDEALQLEREYGAWRGMEGDRDVYSPGEGPEAA